MLALGMCPSLGVAQDHLGVRDCQEQGWKKGHPSSQSSQVFLLGQSGMRGTSLTLVSALEIGNPPPWKLTYLCPPSAAPTAYRYTTSSQLS